MPSRGDTAPSPRPATTTNAMAIGRLEAPMSNKAPTAIMTLVPRKATRGVTRLSTHVSGKRPRSCARPRAPAKPAAVDRSSPAPTITGTCSTTRTDAPKDEAKEDRARRRIRGTLIASLTAARGCGLGAREPVSCAGSTQIAAITNTIPTATAPIRTVSRQPIVARNTSVSGIKTGDAKAPQIVNWAIARTSDPTARRAATVWVRW